MTVEQRRAIVNLRRAIKRFDNAGLAGFLGATGTIHIFEGVVPMDGYKGTLNQDKAIDHVLTGLEAGEE